MSIKLTPRQKQIALLKQRGASNKEIAQVLGVSDATVKTIYKQVCAKCAENGVDVFAMPVEKDARMEEFNSVLRTAKLQEKFGGVL